MFCINEIKQKRQEYIDSVKAQEEANEICARKNDLKNSIRRSLILNQKVQLDFGEQDIVLNNSETHPLCAYDEQLKTDLANEGYILTETENRLVVSYEL